MISLYDPLTLQEIQANLETKLQEISVSLDQQVQKKVHLEMELQAKVQKLKDCEKKNLELQQQQQKLTIESSESVQRLETSIELQKTKIDELQKANGELKAGFEADMIIHQANIEELKAANEQLKAQITQNDAESQKQLNKQEELMTDLKSKWDELEKQHLNTIQLLSNEKSNLAEQLEKLNELHEVTWARFYMVMLVAFTLFNILDKISRTSWTIEGAERWDCCQQ